MLYNIGDISHEADTKRSTDQCSTVAEHEDTAIYQQIYTFFIGVLHNMLKFSLEVSIPHTWKFLYSKLAIIESNECYK